MSDSKSASLEASDLDWMEGLTHNHHGSLHLEGAPVCFLGNLTVEIGQLQQYPVFPNTVYQVIRFGFEDVEFLKLARYSRMCLSPRRLRNFGELPTEVEKKFHRAGVPHVGFSSSIGAL